MIHGQLLLCHWNSFSQHMDKQDDTFQRDCARAVLLVPDCEGIHSTDLLTWMQFGQNRVGVKRWHLDVDRKLEDFRDPPQKKESHGNAEVFCCHGFYSFHNIAQHLQESMYCGTRNRKVMACLKTKRPKLIKILLVSFQT